VNKKNVGPDASRSLVFFRPLLFSFLLALPGLEGAEAATYYWATWNSYSINGTTHTLTGTIATASDTVTVTYTNTQGVAGYQLGDGTGGTANYYSGGTDGADGTSPYTSPTVENLPDNVTIVRLSNAGAQTLTFSQNVSNLAFAFVSLNGNAFSFDRNFDILSFGHSDDGGNACGHFGCGTAAKVVGSGSYPYQVSGTGEPHGTLLFSGAFSALTWTSGNENWHGFTVGIAGTAEEVPDETPPPTVAFTPAHGTTNVALDAVVTLTFNKEVRNLDDTPLTNDNVDSLITLKTGDASGADIPFDAVIDAENKVITVTPLDEFTTDQVVYTAIGATVEDTYGNALTASNATFTTGAELPQPPDDADPAPEADPIPARLYPNPYRAGAGDPNTGITFFNLPEGSTIELFTVTGELVKRLETGNSTSTKWDVRNLTGQDVSTGGYIAVIRSPGGGKAVRKVLVIR
jgi:hypothetical protein